MGREVWKDTNLHTDKLGVYLVKRWPRTLGGGGSSEVLTSFCVPAGSQSPSLDKALTLHSPPNLLSAVLLYVLLWLKMVFKELMLQSAER